MSTEDGLGLISSMATRQLLARLAEDYRAATGQAVTIESVGGVDAARRVADGEAFDLVVLADAALAKLAAGGHLDGAGRVAIARSEVAVAVREDAPHPAIDSGAAVREAVLRARSIGYSTGPSGTHLEALFAQWGIAETIASRIVRARPGVPVAALIAAGEVELGFQQRSELLDQPGIAIVGPLPDEVQAVTVFAGAVGSLCTRREAAAAFLAFLASHQAAVAKLACGMSPA
ncbi:substrate-binding domain-containing protein [Burkholderia gladioli pv. gladioli]|uniref:Bacterial extracellular solute-binding family protein n=2 Tax=Burkholderia TaxID=32008 RepID=A0AAW3F3V2_BURGA|nr:substrate-binding domain-containing protein [Burkholderia gladioli]AJW96913.1 bacterial extracellular solute-binding family protein [Burkholderia gladioli]ASD83292.1 molybdenum ABC transporter substrate-binding protein [Burkholderia gladioli pv. gladioli]AWY50720.1 molybdenum ABC transporter substrate-binding protein [Burkholderia gladioli pv. gladioli]KGC14376.1 bacterial extracellular solute-binding family protein [Burkholderia gladioli]MDJ1167158.1 substrate-binding domain-containing pro